MLQPHRKKATLLNTHCYKCKFHITKANNIIEKKMPSILSVVFLSFTLPCLTDEQSIEQLLFKNLRQGDNDKRASRLQNIDIVKFVF